MTDNFTRDLILNNYSQEDIFAEYLGISYDDIMWSINKGRAIINTHRGDERPSLCFKQYYNKLICKDFGNGCYCGDIFQVVGYIIGRDCNIALDFNIICDDIMRRMDNARYRKKYISERPDVKIESELLSSCIDIVPVYKYFCNADYAYFAKYGLTRKMVNSNYKCVATYYINEYKSVYRSKSTNPCYCYEANPNKVKLVFPYATKNEPRFLLK